MSYQTAFQLGYGNGNVCGFEDLWIDQDHYSRGDYYGY